MPGDQRATRARAHERVSGVVTWALGTHDRLRAADVPRHASMRARGELIVRSHRGSASFRGRSSRDDQALSSTPSPERITPHAATLSIISRHISRASATWAFIFPLRTASLRPHRRSGSLLRSVCTPMATNAHRSYGDPSFVIRPYCSRLALLSTWGTKPASLAKCAGVGKRSTSPISARNVKPSTGPMPCTVCNRCTIGIGERLAGDVGFHRARAARRDRVRSAAASSARGALGAVA